MKMTDKKGDGDAVATQAAKAEPAAEMDINKALQVVLKKALIHDGLARGLRECVKALDRQEAHLCILAKDCEEGEYVRLIEALCRQHKVYNFKVDEALKLGEWAGLCKLDKTGKPRKVVSCSCVVVKDYGEPSPELDYVLNWIKTHPNPDK
jgi:small subunit ribosomal protein S12e